MVYSLSEEDLLEVIRLAYKAGGDDEESGVFKWCQQGSRERAEELIEEFKGDNIL